MCYVMSDAATLRKDIAGASWKPLVDAPGVGQPQTELPVEDMAFGNAWSKRAKRSQWEKSGLIQGVGREPRFMPLI
jgi:hypothetical protein